MSPSVSSEVNVCVPGKADGTSSPSAESLIRLLPTDAAQRAVVHSEVHARPTLAIILPALVVDIAMLNESVTPEQTYQHLRLLPGLGALDVEQLNGNFLRLNFDGFSLT